MGNYKEEDIIEPIKDEIEDDYSNDDLYNITSWGADLSFRELITMYKEGELMKPELQRNYIWEKPEASRFIESLLLGLPVPSIFLAKTNKEKQLIVDGYQRIMTVYEYVETGIFSKDGKVFKLSNSKKINEKWRGKAFNELDETEQRRIKRTTIHAIVFVQDHPQNSDTSMFQIFERINTSGRTLTPQEIRNCVYQGRLNSLLFELNKNNNWRELFGLAEIEPRMKDMEFILRFFGLADDKIKKSEKTQISLKLYLNEFMGKEEFEDEWKLNVLKEEFIKTIDFIYNNIGINAFHNISSEGKYICRFHPTIFDAITISTLYGIIKGDIRPNKDLKQKKIDLLNNSDFQQFISERTTNIAHINGRIKKACNILYGINYE